ncbi:MAG: poly-gamma-glutamate hydrolase family protein [Steroidobacterales bacterium]
MRSPVPADDYRGYEDLASAHAEGVDYAVHVRYPQDSGVAVIAPHGGRIEGGTSAVARLIAGIDHGLYLFEGLRSEGDNFDRLHLTSHCFNEPRCLDLIARCDTVIAVHGYASPGADVLLGGRDQRLKRELAPALIAQGLTVQTDGHPYPGTDPLNICNRGRSGQGVQVELSARLRRAHNWTGLAQAVRSVLGRAVVDSVCRAAATS